MTVTVCPICESPLNQHSDRAAAECYEKFLHKLEILNEERYAPLRVIGGGRSFRRDSVG